MSNIDSNIPVVIVTGANRGLGLGFIKVILANEKAVIDIPENAYVVATSRDVTGCTDLLELQKAHPERLHIVPLDLAEQTSIDEFIRLFKETGFTRLDLLINNAGVNYFNEESLDKFYLDQYQYAHKVNAIGPTQLVVGLLDIINHTHTLKGGEVGKKPEVIKGDNDKITDNDTKVRVFFVGSYMGSIGKTARDRDQLYAYSLTSYRTSKAALNMMALMLAAQHPHIGMAVMHPGWIATSMGGENGAFTPERGAQECIDVINNHCYASTSMSKFWDAEGNSFPW